MSKLIPFKYTIRDRAFCNFERTVIIDGKSVVVIGERKDWRIYDDHKKAYVVTRAFLVNYQGTEYGTLDLSQAELFKDCSCGSSGGGGRYFEAEFANEFE